MARRERKPTNIWLLFFASRTNWKIYVVSLVFVLFLPLDLIKAGATQTETSLLKQYAAGERVDLLDDYDFPARTITETGFFFLSGSHSRWLPLQQQNPSNRTPSFSSPTQRQELADGSDEINSAAQLSVLIFVGQQPPPPPPFPYLMKPPGETSWKLSLFFLYLY